MTAKATVKLWGRANRLPVDPLDDDVRYTFTNGQCHSLALAIVDEAGPGWTLAVLCYDDRGSTRQVGDHVVAVAPDGDLVDIEGKYRHEESRWNKGLPYVRKVKRTTVLGLGWDRIDVDAARPFAKACLARIQTS